MAMNRKIDPDEGWAWCEHAWKQPGEAERLLREQDQHGMDVVLHLFLRWARERHRVELDEAAFAQAQALVRPWRDEVIAPVRALRRRLGQPDALHKKAVRDLLGQAELRAERAQLEALCEWLEGVGTSL
jgi:uncharacterized protein (TIGR02444 family)